MPTFSLLNAPVNLTIYLLRIQNALLPLDLRQIQRFGGEFNARLLSALEYSTSELLRTL
jgi:hypothetical protein